MGGLLHLVQQGGGARNACNSPVINIHGTDHRLVPCWCAAEDTSS